MLLHREMGICRRSTRHDPLGAKMSPAWEIACEAARAGAQQTLGQPGWGGQIQTSPKPPQGLPMVGNDGDEGRSCPCGLSSLP